MAITNTTTPRPGGRSARVQAAVHQAASDLMALGGRAGLTVPLIAARAGVTPSTIYRRWGELSDLLADVAVQRMRPDSEPADTGSVAGDLIAWAEQYRDEMSSEVGVGMMLDVLSSRNGVSVEGRLPVPCQCAAFTASQIRTIVERGVERGEPVPVVDTVMDTVVAPIIYRSLFGSAPITSAQTQTLVGACMKTARLSAPVEL
ncbi:TetR/AcrR family transcriptional regulator [Variovorax sp. PAMC28562]|uniref:TetR/AcrR family transcriptional regulator n=1 Tax=Variovorax sp. PAMC28562 TaxID=2762323 RepID=UPI00164E03D6|nr:TetR/AcrR family transcriptional regulator [Variovorax sp. PAMC28562]QNK73219.1 TetR/AcrR family transcriptional regulator [Variovorax sp. PAMC28562]